MKYIIPASDNLITLKKFSDNLTKEHLTLMINHWKNIGIKDEDLIKAIVEFVSSSNKKIQLDLQHLGNKIKKE